MLVIMFLFAGIAGGGWAAIAGYLKARWNVNETITTLMLNYIAIHLADYFIYGPWKDPDSLGFPMTAPFPEAARLPQFAGTRIHYAYLLQSFLQFYFGLFSVILVGVMKYELLVKIQSRSICRYLLFKIYCLDHVYIWSYSWYCRYGEVSGLQDAYNMDLLQNSDLLRL